MNSLARTRYLGLVLLAAAGAGLSGYLVRQHAHFLLSGQVGGLCSLSEKFDCSKIENSEFSEFLGIPTASFGFFYFLGLLAYLTGFRPENLADSRFRHGAALINAMGVLVSVGLGVLSAFLIRAFCLGCVMIYSVNALMLFLLVPWKRPWTYPMHLARACRDLPWVVLRQLASNDARMKRRGAIAGMMLVLVAPVNFLMVPKYIALERMKVILANYDRSPEVVIPVHPWSISKGGEDAPVQILAFTDFQCPTCRRVSRDLDGILADWPLGSYRMVYRHFPLDRKCNRLVAQIGPEFDIHPGACEVALMAQAASALGGFWRVSARLYSLKDYAENGVLNPEAMRRWFDAMSTEGGLDFEEWMRFSQSGVNQQRVMTDIEDGIKLGLVSTPAVFVNGKRLPGLRRADLRAVLEHVTGE